MAYVKEQGRSQSLGKGGEASTWERTPLDIKTQRISATLFCEAPFLYFIFIFFI